MLGTIGKQHLLLCAIGYLIKDCSLKTQRVGFLIVEDWVVTLSPTAVDAVDPLVSGWDGNVSRIADRGTTVSIPLPSLTMPGLWYWKATMGRSKT